jgi:penicillin-insensitive murein endopeptidase
MGWRPGELWLDADLWLPEPIPVPAVAGFGAASNRIEAVPTGLSASRRRRERWEQDRRARRSRASAMALSPVVAFALAALQADGPPRKAFMLEDPPSLVFRFDKSTVRVVEEPTPSPKPVHHKAPAFPAIAWHHATSVGLPYDGRLVNGTQLPVHGPDWVTWDPITDRGPNLPWRLYGNEHTIRSILSVIRTYRTNHPDAPKVVIGDISRKGGGPLDDHASHQNGLDVDVYFPRLDRKLLAPTSHGQIDVRLSQDLLDGFLHAGAQAIFIGASTGLHGPSGVVMPWPGHDYHMHVRFPPP